MASTSSLRQRKSAAKIDRDMDTNDSETHLSAAATHREEVVWGKTPGGEGELL